MYKQYNDTSDWIVTAYFQGKLNADPERAGRKEKNGSKNNNNISTQTNQRHLGPFQTSNFTCAESNANERKQ